MGMTIDTIIKDCEESINMCELFIKAHQANMEIGEIKEYQYYIERDKLIIDTIRKYQQLQADYETRLKADMVSMLTELQLEIEELKETERSFCHHFERGLRYSKEVIQRKINALKAESEG